MKRHLAAFSLLFLVILACSASTRTKTIQTTLAATQAAGSAFVAYDDQKQKEIVAAAPDLATGRAQLQAWRVNQVEVLTLFSACYQTIAAAALANSDPSVETMITAALNLSKALYSLGVTTPKGTP